MNINLTVIIRSKPAHTAPLEVLLQNLVANSTKEEACIQYELHHSTEDENIFILHEIWKDQQGLDLHNQEPHLIAFGKAVAELVEGPVTIYKTKIIS